MIVPTPTEEQIRSARVITLFDPQRPEFHQSVLDTVDRTKRTPRNLLVVDIPVDSSNPDMLQHMLDWIAAVRSETA